MLISICIRIYFACLGKSYTRGNIKNSSLVRLAVHFFKCWEVFQSHAPRRIHPKKNTSIICAQRRFRYAWTLDSLPFEWLNYPLSAKLALWSDWFMSSLGPHDLLILAYGGLFPIINHGKNFRNHIMARGTTSWYQTQLLSVKKYYWLMSWINVHPDFLVTQKIFSENIKYFRKT